MLHQVGVSFDLYYDARKHKIKIRQTLEKREYNEAMHQLFIDFKEAYDSVRKEVWYSILIEFGIPLKLVRLIKMCVNNTCSRVRVGKYFSDMFPSEHDLKQGDAVSTANCFSALLESVSLGEFR